MIWRGGNLLLLEESVFTQDDRVSNNIPPWAYCPRLRAGIRLCFGVLFYAAVPTAYDDYSGRRSRC